MRTLSRLQNLPLAGQVLLLIVLSQRGNDSIRNFFKVARGKRQNRRTSTRKTHAQKAGLCPGGHGLHNFGETRDEGLAVRLVNFVLHGKMDEFGVGGRLA